MLNCFQKILYYLSNACIAVILISIILNFKYGLSLTYICPGLISFIILILFIISFFIYKDKLADFEINVVDLTEINTDNLSYLIVLISGLSPLINDNILGEVNVSSMFWIINLIVLLISNRVSKQSNIILRLLGYKFYQCKVPTGVSGYVLISKRNFRNNKQLRLAKRVFEYTLLDGGRKSV